MANEPLTNPEPLVGARVRPSTIDAAISTLRELAENWNGAPSLAVAVTGWEWSGNPDIARLLHQRFGDRPHLVCSLNAFDWERESRPPGAMLAAEIARAAGGQRRWWRRAFQPVSTEMSSPQTRWWRRLGAAVTAALLAAVVVALPGVRDYANTLADKSGVVGDLASQATRTPVLAAAVLAALFWFVAVRAWNATTAVARFASSAREEAARGSVGEVRGQLAALIRQALRNRKDRRRFVVVINNLDGCAGDFALAVCEDASKLLRIEDVVVVFIGDLGAVEKAANRKFGTPDADRRGIRHVRSLIPNIVALAPPSADEVRRRAT